MNQYFYIDKDGVETGPKSIEELVGMEKRRQIAPDTLIAVAGTDGVNGSSAWQPLGALLAAAAAMGAEPTDDERHMKKGTVIFLAIIGLSAWFFLFCLGLFVGCKANRDALNKGDFQWKDFGLCCVLYTPTNLLLTTCLAAFAGGAGSRLLHWNEKPGIASSADSGRYIFLRENPFSSMLRGFAVYLTFIAGVFISADSPFSDTNPQQFVRVVGTVSLLAFFVGYDPTLFKLLVNWLPKPKSAT